MILELLQNYLRSTTISKPIYNKVIEIYSKSYLVVVSTFYLFLSYGILVGCTHEKPQTENVKLGLLLLSTMSPTEEIYEWNLPPGFPIPLVPSSNPMSEAKVNLGRFLFYEPKLSGNQTQSCASCHLQSIGFTDGNSVSIGSTGVSHPRNSQPLSNMVYLPRYTWMNNNLKTLEQQSRIPLFGTTPVEMGLDDKDFLERFKRDPRYQSLFQKAFKNSNEPISEQNIRFALSTFQRSLISGNSAYDKYYYQNIPSALTTSMVNGMKIFNGDVAKCSKCHSGFNFTDSTISTESSNNKGIYHDNGNKSTTEYDSLDLDKRGLVELTENPSDTGKFKTPSLRNIALTYPYMHDGSIHCDANLRPTPGVYSLGCATNALGKVIDHYRSGGKTPSNKDSNLIRPFSLTSQEKQDLINFLVSLTDYEFISNPKHSNPF